ncbi:MAG: hypothetical protein ABR913_09260 [Sedimentisphaerales bacterium]|jgi:hypothetical protein
MNHLLIFAEKFGVWFKDLIILPSNLAKVASINKYLETQQKLSETQRRLEEVEKQLANDAAIKAGRMFFSNNVYWAKNANGQIEESPYCPRCFESDGKPVHVTMDYSVNATCPECKAEMIVIGKPK